MPVDLKALRQRHEQAVSARAEMADMLDECFEFTQPLRERIYPSGRTRTTDRLLDATAVTCVEALAASVLNAVWPTDSRPFEVKPGSEIPEDEHEDFAAFLDAQAAAAIQAVNDSNFRAAALEALRDWTICDGVLLVEPGTATRPLIFTSLPIPEAVLDVGPDGAYDALFRQRKRRLAHIPTLWPEARLSALLRERITTKPSDEIEVLEATWRDWSQPRETWRYCVSVKDDDAPLVERSWDGVGSCPFIAFSYSRRASERIGRGPAQLALPDIRSLNVSTEMMLQNGELSLAGIWTYDDDGVINPETMSLMPGTLIPKAVGSDGLKNIAPSGDFRFAEFLAERLTEKVREALFWNDLGSLQRTPRSATELLRRSADRAERMSGPASRLLTEFLFPLVHRVFWLLGRAAGVNRDLRLDGTEGRIRALGPVTRAQAQSDIVLFDQFMEVANARFGPQAAAIAVNHEVAIPWLAERFGMPRLLIRSRADRAQFAQAVAGLAQAAQEAGALPAQA